MQAAFYSICVHILQKPETHSAFNFMRNLNKLYELSSMAVIKFMHRTGRLWRESSMWTQFVKIATGDNFHRKFETFSCFEKIMLVCYKVYRDMVAETFNEQNIYLIYLCILFDCFVSF